MIQEQLFNDWNMYCERLKNLNGFFQNDFSRLINDGITTKEDLIQEMKIFENYCIDINKELVNIRFELLKLIYSLPNKEK